MIVKPSRAVSGVTADRFAGRFLRSESLLGASLVAMRRYSEAEKVLLAARGDLEALPQPPKVDITKTIARLIELYAAWGKRDQAAMYRAQLAS